MEKRIACNDAVPSGCPVKEAYTKKTFENTRGRLDELGLAGARSRQYRLASMLWPHEPRGLASLGGAA
jgi:hypothetical protein